MTESSRIFSRLFVFVLCIKALDVVKNLVIAYLLGVSDSADIYASLVIIPDSIIVLLGLDTIRGVVNSEYAHCYSKGELGEMWNSFNNLFNFLFWISIVTVSIVTLFSSQVIGILLPGFSGEKKINAVEISYIIFPILFFKILTGFFHSVYNSVKSFYFPVFAPVIISLLIILSVVFPYYENNALNNIAFANLAGNFISFVLMVIGLKKIGAMFRFKKIAFDPLSRKVIKGASALIVLVICNQLYLFSKNFFASYFGEGAVSALHYSGTIPGVVVSLIFSVFFTVLISNLSSLFSENQIENAKDLYLKTILTLAFVMVPLVSFLVINAKEILSLVFMRGNYSESGIELTQKPFFWDALSLLSFIFYIIPTALFLAKKNYVLLTKIGSIVYILGIGLNYFLSSYFGFYAIPMATFITTGVYGALLVFNSSKLFGNFRDFYLSLFFIAVSGVITFSVLYSIKFLFFQKYFSQDFSTLLVIVLSNFILLSVVYFAITKLFKVNYVNELMRSFKK